jgi:transcriptional regulator with XRE-family HTH domain
MIHLSEIIKNRRKLLKVTQEELSQQSEVSLRTLKQIELGYGNPTISTLEKITEILGLEIEINIKKMK